MSVVSRFPGASGFGNRMRMRGHLPPAGPLKRPGRITVDECTGPRQRCARPPAPAHCGIFRGVMSSIEQIRIRLSDPEPATSAPSARRASVAIVLAGDSETRSVCFVERASRPGDPWSGDVAFPGGWAKHEHESLRAAAMRETHEEIGLALADTHHVGDIAPMQIPGFRSGIGILGTSVFYVGETRPGLRLEQREIADAFWVPIAHLHHPDNRTVVHWLSLIHI